MFFTFAFLYLMVLGTGIGAAIIGDIEDQKEETNL